MTTPKASRPIVNRPGLTPDPFLNTPGETTFWDDNITTYVHAFESSNATWAFVDETDTLINAIEAIRSGDLISRSDFDRWLDIALKVNHRVTAIIDELLIYAREDDPLTGRPWSWRDIAGGVDPHHTTLYDRHAAAVRRSGSSWREWLLQNGPRSARIPSPPPAEAVRMIVDTEADAETVLKAAGAEVTERGMSETGAVHIAARAADGRSFHVAIRPAAGE